MAEQRQSSQKNMYETEYTPKFALKETAKEGRHFTLLFCTYLLYPCNTRAFTTHHHHYLSVRLGMIIMRACYLSE